MSDDQSFEKLGGHKLLILSPIILNCPHTLFITHDSLTSYFITQCSQVPS